MKGWSKFAVFALVLVAVNAATALVTERNLRSGLYPDEADTIGIPIIGTLVASLIILPFLYKIATLHRSDFVLGLRKKGAAWFTGLALIYMPAFAFSLLGAGYWMDPDHYLISLCFAVMVLFLVGCLATDLNPPLSKTKPDTKKKLEAEEPPG